MNRGTWGVVAPFHPPALVAWEPRAIAAKCDEVCERLSSTCFLTLHGDQCTAGLDLLVAEPGGAIRLADARVAVVYPLAANSGAVVYPRQPTNAVVLATA